MKNFEEFWRTELGIGPDAAMPEAWASQPMLLDAVAFKMQSAGVRLFPFMADARHFWRFSTKAERAVFNALSPEEHDAIFGPGWSEEDFDPETFGYE